MGGVSSNQLASQWSVILASMETTFFFLHWDEKHQFLLKKKWVKLDHFSLDFNLQKKLSIFSSILAFYFPSREERNAVINVTAAEVPVFAI